MKKNLKIIFTFLLTIIILLTSVSFPIEASSDVNIIQDSANTNSLPGHFRKTTNISNSSALTSLNIEGLEKLNISGSGQFTPTNLPLLIENINTNLPIVDIDLRQESHGLINDDMAISFANANNSANAGLTLDEVIEKENSDLSSINLNKPLTLYNNKKIITGALREEIAKELGVYEQVKKDGGWANVPSKTCGNIVTKAIEIANRSVKNV